jgi:hypothetical protein
MSYKYKQIILIGNIKIIEEDYLNLINEDLAFIIFTCDFERSKIVQINSKSKISLDKVSTLNTLLPFDPFSKVLKDPHNWMNKLRINFPFVKWKYLN